MPSRTIKKPARSRSERAAIARALTSFPEAAPSMAALVALRVLVRSAAMPFARGIVDGLRPRVLDLLRVTAADLDEAEPHEVNRAFATLCAWWDDVPAPPVPAGARIVAELLDLDAIERDVVLLLALRERSAALRDVWDEAERSDLAALIAVVTRREASEVEPALRRGASLARRRILVAGEMLSPWGLAPGLADLVVREDVTASEILARFVRRSRAPRTRIEDFSYLGEPLAILERYLAGALACGRAGAHVLLHGAPGVGKTELARALAAKVGAELFEVADEDDDGEPLDREARLGAYALAQRTMRRAPNAVLLFDEAEDAFPRSIEALFGLPHARKDKGWLHRLLEEESPRPCVWAMNAVDAIDPATLRRFDLVFEIPTPPAAVRLEMAEARLGAHVRRPWIEHVARSPQLGPASVDRLARVAHLVSATAGDATPATIERQLGEVLRAASDAQRSAESSAAVASSNTAEHATPYDLAYVNASVPAASIVRGLAAKRRATLLFSGPPGTGKTAFARHLAEAIGAPMIEAQASSLLSSYLGETERNVAALFRRAHREGALLMVDEVDTFLQDRRGAQRQWEASVVNQFLVSIEAFEGTLVATTNRLEHLDTAVLRRFSAKVTFAPLTLSQAASLLRRMCEAEVTDEDARALERTSGVTAGDFAAARRRLDLLGEAMTPAVLVRAVRDEVALRRAGEPRSVAGFG